MFFAYSYTDGIYGYIDVVEEGYARFIYVLDGLRHTLILEADEYRIIGKIEII